VLLIAADTGGGHRAAAQAISEELTRLYPDRFAPVLCDPLLGHPSRGVGAAWPLRAICGLYGPVIRLAPWLWGAVWHATDSRLAQWLLRHSLLVLARRPTAAAVTRHQPAVIVSLHPLTGSAAAWARARHAPSVPLVTVVTDLVTPHASWRDGASDLIVTPTAAAAARLTGAAHRPDQKRLVSPPAKAGAPVEAGLPVGAGFRQGPAGPWERVALRRSLGVPADRFLVVLTGGAEGCGRMARRTAALAQRPGDVQVVAICGRNRRLRRRLERLATRCADRLTVLGFVPNMADWLRCADIVAGKAGPGTIAEAACCGAPLILTAQLPGQEKGNAAFVAQAGAGRYVPQTRRFAREVARLRADPATLESMREASARLARPTAATAIATALAALADPHLTHPRLTEVPRAQLRRAEAPLAQPQPAEPHLANVPLVIVEDFGCSYDQNPPRSADSPPRQLPVGPVGPEMGVESGLAGPGPDLAQAGSGSVGALAGWGPGHGD
jgi:1,2-diacylglycerol 3-beta-galactosyltransferase